MVGFVTKVVLVVLAICVVIQGAPTRERSCYCYRSMYDCDFTCANQYKSTYFLKACLTQCARYYANCIEKCTGEKLNINFPQYADHQNLVDEKIKDVPIITPWGPHCISALDPCSQCECSNDYTAEQDCNRVAESNSQYGRTIYYTVETGL